MLPIDQLTKPVTKAQAKATIHTMLAKAGISITSWQSGAVLRALIWVVATIISVSTQLLAVIVQGLFLDTAASTWLTLLAKYVYGVNRRGATFASGTLSFSNAKGGEYPFAVNECIALNPDTGKLYWNTEAFTLAPLGSATVAFEAKEAGSDSTSAVATITALVTPLIGVTLTNNAAFIGTDEQLDEELRQDCRDALGALSPFGAAGAYKYFAKHVPGGDPLTRADGSAVDVNRAQVKTDPSTGAVTVWIASPSGEVVPDDVDLVHENLQTNAVPQCITETTESAEAVVVTVLYQAYADVAAGKTTADLKAAINAQLLAYGKTYPIAGQQLTDGGQGYLFLNRVRAICLDADPALVAITLITPLADTELNDGQIANIAPAMGSTVTLVTQAS